MIDVNIPKVDKVVSIEETNAAIEAAFRLGIASAYLKLSMPHMGFTTQQYGFMEFQPGSVDKLCDRLHKFVETGN